MLSAPPCRRKPSARDPFCAPLWDDDHPAVRRIEAGLPPEHHARWLQGVVARLDLTSFRRSYAGYGSLAYPPEQLLPFVLYLYSEGVLSPAAWAERARYDDRCKWLLRGLQPSRFQLYTFRDRVEPFVDDWHKQLIAWAVTEGLTTARHGNLDGTFVAALASRHQLLSRRCLDRRLLLLRLLVWLDESPGPADLAQRLNDLPELLLTSLVLWLFLLQAGLVQAPWPEGLLNLLALLELLAPAAGEPWPHLPAWMPTSVAGRQRVLKRYEDAQQRLRQRLEPFHRKKKLSKKDLKTIKRMKVSLTDAEAALGWDKQGTYRPLYNLTLVHASDAPLTLAWDVLSRNNDDGLLKPLMEKTKEHLGHHLDAVNADGAFVSVGEVAWCEQQGITVYGPPKKKATDAAEQKEVEGQAAATSPGQRSPVHKEKQLPKEAFRYDPTEKVYYCPEGKRLEVRTRTTVQRQNGLSLPVIVHQASSQDCLPCPQQPRCTSNPNKGRVVKRYQGEEALERLHQRMTEPASQKTYRLRGQTVELGYADLKQHRGLRVFRCFGRKRARAQAGLVILASNGLKIMHALQRRQSTPTHHETQQMQPP